MCVCVYYFAYLLFCLTHIKVPHTKMRPTEVGKAEPHAQTLLYSCLHALGRCPESDQDHSEQESLTA